MSHAAAGFVRKALRINRDLGTWVDEFGRVLFAELDYVREADNSEVFARRAAPIPAPHTRYLFRATDTPLPRSTGHTGTLDLSLFRASSGACPPRRC